MSEKTKNRVYLIYGILQSLLLAVLALCLILACLDIYDGGKGIFSREAVAEHQYLLIPIILCLAGVIAGIVLLIRFPREPRKLRGNMEPAAAIRKMSPRLDKESCPSRYHVMMKKEQTLRLILRLAASILCIALAIPCLIYLFDLTHFDDIGTGLTEDIAAAMFFVLPAAIEGLGAWIVVTFGCHDSYRRELSILKLAIQKAPAKGKPPVQVCDTSKEKIILWSVRGAVLLVAVVFIVLGIFNGGMNDVLQKAIRICTECIGLG